MTKVRIRFQLQTPLNEIQLGRLADLRGVYGILHFEAEAGASTLGVEYDATRLRPEEVGALLRQAGIAATAG